MKIRLPPGLCPGPRWGITAPPDPQLEKVGLDHPVEKSFPRHCEEGRITGAAFVDLSAAYDTVNHRILTRKLFEITHDVKLTELIQNMLSNRRFYVDLAGKRSRWRRQKNGLPQGSVIAPLLFNIYSNDQPVHPNTRSFLYADDLCIATQKQSFE